MRGNPLQVTIAAMLAGLALLAVPASAPAATAGVAGTVTDEETDEPLANVRVAIARTGRAPAWETRTDAAGAYAIGGLEAGEYDVLFQPAEGANYVPEWYYDEPDQSQATSLTLVEGQTATDTDADLAPGSTIAGRVTDRSGEPAARVCVGAFVFERNTGTIRSAGSATTDGAGGYSIAGLGAGFYKLWIGPWEGLNGKCPGGARGTGYVEQWLGSRTDFFSAEPLKLMAQEERAGVDAQLDRTGGAGPNTGTGTGTGTGSGTPPSAQAERCVVPRLRGTKAAVVGKALRRAGCKLGRTTRRAHARVKRGRVIATKPGAGTSLPAGASVAVVVSRGPARGR